MAKGIHARGETGLVIHSDPTATLCKPTCDFQVPVTPGIALIQRFLPWKDMIPHTVVEHVHRKHGYPVAYFTIRMKSSRHGPSIHDAIEQGYTWLYSWMGDKKRASEKDERVMFAAIINLKSFAENALGFGEQKINPEDGTPFRVFDANDSRLSGLFLPIRLEELQ